MEIGIVPGDDLGGSAPEKLVVELPSKTCHKITLCSCIIGSISYTRICL